MDEGSGRGYGIAVLFADIASGSHELHGYA